MGLAIIVLLALFLFVKVVDAGAIMRVISDASTLLSITLSIFAIMYTYTSNNEMHRQFEKINSAADRISRLANDMTLLEGSIQAKLDDFGKGQRDIAAGIKALTNDKIDNVPGNNASLQKSSQPSNLTQQDDV